MSDVDFFSAAHCPPAASATAVISYESSPVSTAPGSKGRTMSAIPSRRHVLKAGAWAVPAVVVASAAPAYATSTGTDVSAPHCVPTPYELSWSSASWQTAGGAGAAASSGIAMARALVDRANNPDVTVQVSRSFSGGMQAHGDSGTGNNLQISPSNVGGTGSRGLTLYQRYPSSARGAGAGAAQTVVFTFGQNVKELAFTITDIDGTAGQFHDCVTMSLEPHTVTHSSERRRVGGWFNGRYEDVPTTQGRGTASSPLTSVARTAVDNTSDSLGNVRVSFRPEQEIRSFSLTFYNSITGTLSSRGQQAIYLSNFSFTADVCR